MLYIPAGGQSRLAELYVAVGAIVVGSVLLLLSSFECGTEKRISISLTFESIRAGWNAGGVAFVLRD